MAQAILTQVGRLGALSAGGAFIWPFIAFDVDAGERAVMYDALRGILPDPVGEGTHFLIPGLQKAHIMSVRAMPKEVKSRTGTKDLQNVNIALRILSRPKEAALPKIFDTLGVNFNDRILPSVVNEVLKSIVAKYNAEELLSKRSLISAEIKAELEKRANAFDLELVDVAITHLVYGKEFATAIEAKQVAQQDAERQKWVVEKADKEREAAVIRAEGEAEAAQIVNQALQESGPGLIEVLFCVFVDSTEV
mmetsp:Transcript_65662/g.132139  ORF Transcript_65662/g.132139 Transcript_65662/m.132139 type:complete len:250 (+) Transcript_65662:46-795(+)